METENPSVQAMTNIIWSRCGASVIPVPRYNCLLTYLLTYLQQVDLDPFFMGVFIGPLGCDGQINASAIEQLVDRNFM